MPPERFKRLWTTPHRGNPGALAAAYGVVADRVGSASQVAEVVRVGGKGVRVVVVKSEGADNVAWHDRIHAAVAAALGERFRA